MLNADEAVAYGATVMAGLVIGEDPLVDTPEQQRRKREDEQRRRQDAEERKQLVAGLGDDEHNPAAVPQPSALEETKEPVKQIRTQGKRLIVNDVLPLTLSVQTQGNTVDKQIGRNATIPCECTKEYTTVRENMQKITINIRQGESLHADRNHSLGKIVIRDIPPGPPGHWIFEVTFRVDENNILKVTVRRND